MQKAIKNEIRLGVFITISVLLLIAGIYYVGQRQQLFSSTFHVSGVFSDISGLQVGNNVRFSGINVGIVSDIQQVTDSTVSVDMLIVEHTRKFMKKNVIAVIGSDGLMGNKIVLIIPGVPGQAVLADDDVIATVQPVSVDDIMLKVKTTVDNTANITNDLSIIMLSIRKGKGTIGKLLMDSALAQNVSQAMLNIKQGAGGFKQNMDAASHNFLLRGYLKKKKNAKADSLANIKQLEKDKEKQLEKDKKKKK